MLLILAPYFMVIFFWNNPTVLTVMSYVPFSAPVAMPTACSSARPPGGSRSCRS
jgi:hypothetical protein